MLFLLPDFRHEGQFLVMSDSQAVKISIVNGTSKSLATYNSVLKRYNSVFSSSLFLVHTEISETVFEHLKDYSQSQVLCNRVAYDNLREHNLSRTKLPNTTLKGFKNNN